MAYKIEYSASLATLTGHLQLVAGSYRFLSFSMHGDPANPAYAYIIHDASGLPPQRLFLDLTYQQLAGSGVTAGTGGELAAAQRAEGFYPKLITVTGGVPTQKYALVFEYSATPPPALPYVYLRISPEALFAADTPGKQLCSFNGFLSSLDVIYNSTDDDLEVAAVWWQGAALLAGGPPNYPDPATYIRPATMRALYREALQGDDPDMYRWDEHLNHQVMRKGFVRPELVVPAPIPFVNDQNLTLERSVFTYWEGDTLEPWPLDLLDFTGGILVRGPMMLAHARKAKYTVPPGYEPYRIAVKGWGASTRACMLFAKRLHPLPRTRLVVVGKGEGAPERMPPWKPKVPPGKLPGAPPAPPPPPHSDGAKPRRPRDTQHRPGRPAKAAKLASIAEGLPFAVDLKGPPFVPFPTVTFPDDVIVYQGDPGNPQDPTPPQPPANYYDQLDNYIFSLLYAVGARAAQLAVARGGKLVVVRTYTWAEENYLVAKPTHLFRIGSTGKQLTGMAVVAKFTPDEILNLGIGGPGGSLGFSNPVPAIQANLQQTTIAQLMAHVAGWPDQFDVYSVSDAAGHAYPPRPGDLTNFAQTTSSDFYLWPPGQNFLYGSTGPTLLSEGLGWKLVGDRASYEPEMQHYWFPGTANPETRAQAIPGTPELALASKHIPVHVRVPGTRDFIDEQGNATRVPAAFGGPAQYLLATGGWGMSGVDLVRVISGLDLSSNAFANALTANQVDLIRTTLVNPNTYTALFTVNGSLTPPVRSLYFAGGGYGCCCAGNIDFPGFDASGKSMVFTLLLDTDDVEANRPNQTDLSAIRAILAQMEQTYPLVGDLFDAIP